MRKYFCRHLHSSLISMVLSKSVKSFKIFAQGGKVI
jgi:hypothetical protein